MSVNTTVELVSNKKKIKQQFHSNKRSQWITFRIFDPVATVCGGEDIANSHFFTFSLLVYTLFIDSLQ